MSNLPTKKEIVGYVIKTNDDRYVSTNRRFNVAEILTGIFSTRFLTLATIFNEKKSVNNFIKRCRNKKITNWEILDNHKICGIYMEEI